MAQYKKVISIDHGNRHIKTLNHVFPASYVESTHLPSIGGDVLEYKGAKFTLVDKRMPQKIDKTVDESNYILTLFAIGRELMNDEDFIANTALCECVEIVLLVGLPPLHCKEMGERFMNYFKRQGEQVAFELNKFPYVIKITDAYVYPQAYSAVMTVKEKVVETQFANLVDVGGYTVDLLLLNGIRADMSVCTSLYGGVNSLFQKINEQVRAKGAMNNIPDSIIEGILLDDSKVLSSCSQDRIDLVRSNAEQFARELILNISQEGLDINENQTVFVGGGSIMLREYIEKSRMITKPFFVDNVQANAVGYQLLYDNRKVA